MLRATGRRAQTEFVNVVMMARIGGLLVLKVKEAYGENFYELKDLIGAPPV